MNQQCEVDLTYSTRGIEEKNNLLYTEIIDNILVGQYQDGGGWNGMGRGVGYELQKICGAGSGEREDSFDLLSLGKRKRAPTTDM